MYNGFNQSPEETLSSISHRIGRFDPRVLAALIFIVAGAVIS